MIDHDQTKLIFENWNSFVNEAKTPKYAENPAMFQKVLLGLIDKLSSGGDIPTILSKIEQLKKFANDAGLYYGKPEFKQVFDNHKDLIQIAMSNPSTLGQELEAEREKEDAKRKSGSIRSRSQKEDYIENWRKFHGLPPKSYVPGRDNKMGDLLLWFFDLKNWREKDLIDWIFWVALFLFPIGKFTKVGKVMFGPLYKAGRKAAPKSIEILLKVLVGNSVLNRFIRMKLAEASLLVKYFSNAMAYSLLDAKYLRWSIKLASFVAQGYIFIEILNTIQYYFRKYAFDENDPKSRMIEERIKAQQDKFMNRIEQPERILKILTEIAQESPNNQEAYDDRETGKEQTKQEAAKPLAEKIKKTIDQAWEKDMDLNFKSEFGELELQEQKSPNIQEQPTEKQAIEIINNTRGGQTAEKDRRKVNNIAVSLYKSGDYKAATNVFTQLMNKDLLVGNSRSSTKKAIWRARLLYQLARTKQQAEDIESAREYYTKFLTFIKYAPPALLDKNDKKQFSKYVARAKDNLRNLSTTPTHRDASASDEERSLPQCKPGQIYDGETCVDVKKYIAARNKKQNTKKRSSQRGSGVIFLKRIDQRIVQNFKKDYGATRQSFNKFYQDLKSKNLFSKLGRREDDYQFGPYHAAAYLALKGTSAQNPAIASKVTSEPGRGMDIAQTGTGGSGVTTPNSVKNTGGDSNQTTTPDKSRETETAPGTPKKRRRRQFYDLGAGAVVMKNKKDGQNAAK